MTNGERVLKEGLAKLDVSGWDSKLVSKLKEAFTDFVGQAPYDIMLQNAEPVLWSDEHEKTIDILWRTERLKCEVIIYEDYSMHFDCGCGKYENGVKIYEDEWAVGGNNKYDEEDVNETWAWNFYAWMEDCQFATLEERQAAYGWPKEKKGNNTILYVDPKILGTVDKEAIEEALHGSFKE